MRRFLKVVIAILLLAVLVLLLALAFLAYFIDLNKLRPQIEEEVRKRTGYRLVIDGALSWSLYPHMAVTIEHMVLALPNQTAPFLELKGVRFATDKLLQLSMQNQSIQGVLSIDSVRLNNIHANHAQIYLAWQNKSLSLKPFSASLYDGVVSGDIHAEMIGMMPHWNWNLEFKHIQVDALLSDILKEHEVESRLSLHGFASANVKLAAVGNNLQTLLNKLYGTTNFYLEKGLLKGVDLNFLLRSAQALISKQSLLDLDDTGQTPFDSLSASLMIKDGGAKTNDLLLKSTTFTTTGRGEVNLPYQTIHLHLFVKPLSASNHQWEIPVVLSGDLTEPDIRLDMNKLQKLMTGENWQQTKQELTEKVGEQISKAEEYVQRLLGV